MYVRNGYSLITLLPMPSGPYALLVLRPIMILEIAFVVKITSVSPPLDCSRCGPCLVLTFEAAANCDSNISVFLTGSVIVSPVSGSFIGGRDLSHLSTFVRALLRMV